MNVKYLIPKIPLPLRFALFFSVEVFGAFTQFMLNRVFIGVLISLAGTILVIAKNYRNKPLDLGFEDWQPVSFVEFNRIEENLKLGKKMKTPFIYQTGFGCLIYVLLGIAGFIALINDNFKLLLLFFDIVIATFPLLFTGNVSIWTPQELQMKMERFRVIVQDAEKFGKDLIVTPYLRLDKDKEGKKIPEDIRLMVEPRRKPSDFVGVQFQIAINKGPKGNVPYMYSVFLCKGKGETYKKFADLSYGTMIKEPGGDKEYGYVVVRQNTSGGGYHTTGDDCSSLFSIVIEALRKLS